MQQTLNPVFFVLPLSKSNCKQQLLEIVLNLQSNFRRIIVSSCLQDVSSLKGLARDLCVQMAMGRPPYADLHPMRALFLIPAEDAPRLDGPFSQEFKSFVAQCLQKVHFPFLPSAHRHDNAPLQQLSLTLTNRCKALHCWEWEACAMALLCDFCVPKELIGMKGLWAPSPN